MREPAKATPTQGISSEFYVPSTAQGHPRTNHTFTTTPYQVETQVTITQVKRRHTVLPVLHTTQSIANVTKPKRLANLNIYI